MVCREDFHTAAFAFYRYVPSVAAAAIFCIIFLVSGFLHLFQMCKTKTWYLTCLVVGCFLEVIGYAGRAASASQEVNCWTLGPYIIQGIFTLVPPALFAASIYIILGRVILLTDGESHSMIKQSKLTKTFVWGDVFCFWMQSGGGGLQAASQSELLPKIGKYVVIAGLVLQIVWFGFFVVVTSTFHRRMLQAPTARAQQPEIRWQVYLNALYICSALIMVRSVFRVLEYGLGSDGYLMTHEWFLYIFDAVPMMVVVVWLHWKHPSEIGLLLRGMTPATNGFKLVTMRRPKANGI